MSDASSGFDGNDAEVDGDGGGDNTRSTADVQTTGDKVVSVLSAGVVLSGIHERVESGANERVLVARVRISKKFGVILHSFTPVSVEGLSGVV